MGFEVDTLDVVVAAAIAADEAVDPVRVCS